jgi:hypothetical protein
MTRPAQAALLAAALLLPSAHASAAVAGRR